jgi:hypothetical protein
MLRLRIAMLDFLKRSILLKKAEWIQHHEEVLRAAPSVLD